MTNSTLTIQLLILTTSIFSFLLLSILLLGLSSHILPEDLFPLFTPSSSSPLYFTSTTANSGTDAEAPRINHPEWPPVHPRIFHNNATAIAIAATKNTTWADLFIPPSGGGIRISADDPSLVDPVPQYPVFYDEKVGHGIAMFHQLHCLIMLRSLVFPEASSFFSSSSSSSSTSTSTLKARRKRKRRKRKTTMTMTQSRSEPERYADDDDGDGGYHGSSDSDRILFRRGDTENHEHWAHCFDYLAQALLCAADDTIERSKKAVHDGLTYWYVDGDGAMHQCRDAGALWELSMRSFVSPMNMSTWQEGEGARSFFKDYLRKPYIYNAPDIFV